MHISYLKELEQTYLDCDLAILEVFQNKTILFTGASGLIGRYFIDFIMYINRYKNANIKIIACDIDETRLNKIYEDYLNDKHFKKLACDITVPFSSPWHIDYIIHAASPANPYFYANFPVDVIKANVIGTLNMLNMAKENSAQMLFISSGEVYGSQEPQSSGYVEEQPGIVQSAAVRSCYTESKRCSETLVCSYAFQYGVSALGARLCFIYGPTYSPKDTRAIFQFLNDYFAGKDIVMKSEGLQVRSYCYVGDCVRALLVLLAKGEKGQMYNVSNSKSVVSIRDIAYEVGKPDLQVVFEIPTSSEARGFSPYSKAVQDCSKLEALGFASKVDFSEGIRRTKELTPLL